MTRRTTTRPRNAERGRLERPGHLPFPSPCDGRFTRATLPTPAPNPSTPGPSIQRVPEFRSHSHRSEPPTITSHGLRSLSLPVPLGSDVSPSTLAVIIGHRPRRAVPRVSVSVCICLYRIHTRGVLRARWHPARMHKCTTSFCVHDYLWCDGAWSGLRSPVATRETSLGILRFRGRGVPRRATASGSSDQGTCKARQPWSCGGAKSKHYPLSSKVRSKRCIFR